MNKWTDAQFAKFFDHTLLKPDAAVSDFEKLCLESKQWGFKMVAINSFPVALCKELLKDSDIHVGAAIAFPLGQMTVEAKLAETEDAIKHGCDEIDYVINLTKLKAGDYAYMKDEMERITALCRENDVISKVIFENCFLTEDEIKNMAHIAAQVRPDFIKTSTGFGTHGATAEHVRLMKKEAGNEVKVKAAGGIRDLKTALDMIDAGAQRLGSSASVEILKEYQKS